MSASTTPTDKVLINRHWNALQTKPARRHKFQGDEAYSFPNSNYFSASRLATTRPAATRSGTSESFLPVPEARTTSLYVDQRSTARAPAALPAVAPSTSAGLVDVSDRRRESFSESARSTHAVTAPPALAPREKTQVERDLDATIAFNKRLRKENETLKASNDEMTLERASFGARLAKENEVLQSLFDDTKRIKQVLGDAVRTLANEKTDLAKRASDLERENAELRGMLRKNGLTYVGASANESRHSVEEQPFEDVLRGNIADVVAINEALRESLGAIRLRP